MNDNNNNIQIMDVGEDMASEDLPTGITTTAAAATTTTKALPTSIDIKLVSKIFNDINSSSKRKRDKTSSDDSEDDIHLSHLAISKKTAKTNQKKKKRKKFRSGSSIKTDDDDDDDNDDDHSPSENYKQSSVQDIISNDDKDIGSAESDSDIELGEYMKNPSNSYEYESCEESDDNEEQNYSEFLKNNQQTVWERHGKGRRKLSKNTGKSNKNMAIWEINPRSDEKYGLSFYFSAPEYGFIEIKEIRGNKEKFENKLPVLLRLINGDEVNPPTRRRLLAMLKQLHNQNQTIRVHVTFRLEDHDSSVDSNAEEGKTKDLLSGDTMSLTSSDENPFLLYYSRERAKKEASIGANRVKNGERSRKKAWLENNKDKFAIAKNKPNFCTYYVEKDGKKGYGSLNMSADNAKDAGWNIKKAAREIWQNVLDKAVEQNGFVTPDTISKDITTVTGNIVVQRTILLYNDVNKFASVTFKRDRNNYNKTSYEWISHGAYPDLEEILTIGFSSKRNDARLIGTHGEGLKVGICYLLNNGYEVEITSGKQRRKFIIQPGSGTRTVIYKRQKLKNYYSFTLLVKHNNERISKRNQELGKDLWNVQDYFLCLDDIFLAQNEGDMLEVGNGEVEEHILFANKYRGKVYVKGVYVMDYKNLHYGININVDIGRDRDNVHDWVLRRTVVNMWFKAIMKSEMAAQRYYDLFNTGSSSKTYKEIQFLSDCLDTIDIPEDVSKEIVLLYEGEYGEDTYPVEEDATEGDFVRYVFAAKLVKICDRGLLKILYKSHKYNSIDAEKKIQSKKLLESRQIATDSIKGIYGDKFLKVFDLIRKKCHLPFINKADAILVKDLDTKRGSMRIIADEKNSALRVTVSMVQDCTEPNIGVRPVLRAYMYLKGHSREQMVEDLLDSVAGDADSGPENRTKELHNKQLVSQKKEYEKEIEKLKAKNKDEKDKRDTLRNKHEEELKKMKEENEKLKEEKRAREEITKKQVITKMIQAIESIQINLERIKNRQAMVSIFAIFKKEQEKRQNEITEEEEGREKMAEEEEEENNSLDDGSNNNGDDDNDSETDKDEEDKDDGGTSTGRCLSSNMNSVRNFPSRRRTTMESRVRISKSLQRMEQNKDFKFYSRNVYNKTGMCGMTKFEVENNLSEMRLSSHVEVVDIIDKSHPLCGKNQSRVVAKHDIYKGDFIIPYIGELRLDDGRTSTYCYNFTKMNEVGIEFRIPEAVAKEYYSLLVEREETLDCERCGVKDIPKAEFHVCNNWRSREEGKDAKPHGICKKCSNAIHPLFCCDRCRLSMNRVPNQNIKVVRAVDLIVDASKIGNEARFINDYRNISKSGANVLTDLACYQYTGEFLLGVYAIKNIKKGEELLLDYGEDYWRHHSEDSNVIERHKKWVKT